MAHDTFQVLELFRGSGSVGNYLKRSKRARFEVVSLDIECKYNPTLCGDILTWDFEKAYPPQRFDIIWASPPCTEYSIAKTRAPRNMTHADKIVKRVLQIIAYFRPKVYIIENPATGYLKTRSFMQGIPYYDVTYCKYGYTYKKPTRLWTNLLTFKPKFCKQDCDMLVDGKHIHIVGDHKKSIRPWLKHTGLPLSQVYSIPPRLLKSIFDAALRDFNAL
jgi:hypothetical protein